MLAEQRAIGQRKECLRLAPARFLRRIEKIVQWLRLPLRFREQPRQRGECVALATLELELRLLLLQRRKTLSKSKSNGKSKTSS